MSDSASAPPAIGVIDGAAHVFPVRVYFEDTDAGGVVYHASYVRFFERARTDFLHALGVSNRVLAAGDAPMYFVVRRMTLDFAAPAMLEDDLTVRSVFGEMRGARLFMAQRIFRGQRLLVGADLELACVTPQGRPARPPKVLVNAILPYRGGVLKST